jgi:tripartite-type tricarboxylate transporter receptor subunit TctC
MKLPRRKFLHLAAGAAALPAVSRVAWAQAYPTKPMRLIIGFPPGSASDILARIISQWLTERIGQPVIVESKPGAGGNISVQTALAAPPDGYTLVQIAASNAVNATLFESLPFDLLRDLAPVAGLATFPFVMNVNPALPVKTVAEFIALAKASPGKISMASFGSGSTSHLAGELFKTMTDVRMTHVPYRGSPPAHVDLMSGQVQVMFDTLVASLPHIRAGTIRALAVTGSSRLDVLPDTPTVADTVPGFEVGGWNGFAVRRDVPPPIIERLNAEINAGLADPTIKARIAQAIAVPLVLSPAQFGAHMAAETEKWGKVIRAANIKPEQG